MHKKNYLILLALVLTEASSSTKMNPVLIEKNIKILRPPVPLFHHNGHSTPRVSQAAYAIAQKTLQKHKEKQERKQIQLSNYFAKYLNK
jgi:hypothetical protein